MKTSTIIRGNLAHRLRDVRIDRCGEGHAAVATFAEALGIPPRTWANYEAGVSMPAEILLLLIEQTGLDHRWLLTGHGPRYGLATSGSRLGAGD